MDDEHESIRYLLTLICKLSRDRSRVLMAEIGIHCGQGIALRQLWRTDGVTQSELAHSLHVAPATVTIALQRMERIGLIERRSDQRDQRVSRVFLTDRGRSLRANVEGNWSKLEEQMLVGFSSKEREVMREYLLRMRANLDDIA
jgi:DNA-binding MarR family transcriptional regulator